MSRIAASFGQGDGPIHVSNIRCNGTETQLQDCAYSQSNMCTHASDAGVACVGMFDFRFKSNFPITFTTCVQYALKAMLD